MLDSTSYGNYNDAGFSYKTMSGTSAIKTSGSSRMISTGATEYSKLKNIYDLAGNVREWNMETYNSLKCSIRGGSYSFGGSTYPISYREGFASTYFGVNIGFRVQLYIK